MLILAAVAPALVCCSKEGQARRAFQKAAALYDQGKYAEALPLLEKAREAGLKDGTLLYQLGFSREAVASKPGAQDGGEAAAAAAKATAARRETWNEAQPILEQEVQAPGGATLERLYYLTVIHSDRGEWDRMRQYAQQAIEQYEKGPDPNALRGEDWFRLARLHDFLGEASEAEAAYRRSVSGFAKEGSGSPIYRALALVKVAEFDMNMARFSVAAEEFDQSLALYPGSGQVRPFAHGLALLGARRFDEAAARFGEDRTETNAESQYGADLARKAKEVAPVEDKDTDGTPLTSIPEEALLERIREAAKAVRAAREKNEYRPGDPLPAEVAVHQRRFVALLGERFLRTKALQEFCLREGIADLVRR